MSLLSLALITGLNSLFDEYSGVVSVFSLSAEHSICECECVCVCKGHQTDIDEL